jgi:predicted metal-dependent TIM-barrel fold hydrolase
MKKISLMVGLALMVAVGVQAAPVESVESARSAALQKLENFLAEKAVVKQMTALGLKPQDVRARLAKLDDKQLEQLAAQADQIRAAGTIQDSGTNWSIDCFFRQLGALFENIFRAIFCWADWK